MEEPMNDKTTHRTTLVLGGTGKTGRRVVERLEARGLPVRVGSRSGEPPFDWEDEATWAPALGGVGAVYLTYYPDFALPGAIEATHSFAELAIESGAPRLVLLSGRGEPLAERGEDVIRNTGAELTILRSTWFMQNLSEDYMREHVLSGEIRLPAGDVPTPFLDADDIADAEHGAPPELVELLTYLFSEVVDGRNADTTDGVRRALGHDARDFRDFARAAATNGAWDPAPISA
jgi:uncharacterized protein YbjT (DUF2867 family)